MKKFIEERIQYYLNENFIKDREKYLKNNEDFKIAYNKGIEDFKNNITVINNPYNKNDLIKFNGWLCGWKEQRSGTAKKK
jgi:hypothetical protein